MKANIIYNKSCVNMSEVNDNSIRLIVTSPPYYNIKDYGDNEQIGKSSNSYTDYIKSMLPVWKECYRILKPNGKLCINTPIMPMEKKIMNTHYNRDFLNINNDIEFSIICNTKFYRFDLKIWEKGPTSQLMFGSYPVPTNFYGLNTFEFINIFVKDGEPEKISNEIKEKSKLNKKTWREYISGIWQISTEGSRWHPAPFPTEIPLRLIKLYSFVDDIILDPFMGSGTTGIVARKLLRKYIGYELNKEFIKFSKERGLAQANFIEKN